MAFMCCVCQNRPGVVSFCDGCRTRAVRTEHGPAVVAFLSPQGYEPGESALDFMARALRERQEERVG